MKRFNPKKSNSSKNKKLIQKSSYEAVEYLTVMTEAILLDDFKFTEEQINKFKRLMNHYSTYISKGTVSFQEVREIIRRKRDENKGM